jgi:hypothetical protein
MPRSRKTTLAVALALGALAPATASARPIEPNGPPAQTQADLDDLARSTVVAPAPNGFDWTDAGIGAAAGIGISLVAVGGSFVLIGKRRHYAPARQPAR